MVDRVTMQDTGGKFDKHPAGTFTAVCVDVIDLGTNVEAFQNNEPKLKQKVVLVFATGEIGPESGNPVYASCEYVLSGHAKSKLRLQLEAWRGRPYTDGEIRGGFKLENLVGMAVTITVSHITTSANRIFAKVVGLAPIMKGATPPDHSEYERDDYWEIKKIKYAAAVEEHFRKIHGGSAAPRPATPKAAPAPAAATAEKPKDLRTLRDELEEADEELPF
jgi:hypothetical protein